MSLDGIVVKSIANELENTILNGKIDKIYQPEEDEILINLRSKGNNVRLLMSASSNNPRIYLTENKKSNPIKPPMFCMLLRKHLQGGRIIAIKQPLLERIINIEIESLDELGVMSTKELIIEIMGRHSNIILLEQDSKKVIDSIKRITPDISRVRQIMPGSIYKLPPSQDKLNPLFINKEQLIDKINNTNEGTEIYKFIYKTYMGISPLIAREICQRAGLNSNLKLGGLSEHNRESLFISFNNVIDNINFNRYEPTMVIDEENSKALGFSVIDITQYGDMKKIHFDSVSKVLEEYFTTRDKLDRIKQKSIDLRKVINTNLDRAKKKIAKQKQELINAEKREKYKIYGDLITANIYRIEKGQEKVNVQNFYSEEQEEIEIRLDNRLTPSQNAQKYYKRYNKLKNAHKLVAKQIEFTKQEIDYLEHILVSIDNCTEVKELDEIKEELAKEGYIKARSKNKKKNKKSTESTPRHYISSDGYDIYIGKNNKQNDYLTLKFASKDDIWLHTKDIPGSHVIIKTKGEEVPETTLDEAALLAAYYSKGKMSSNVPVDYTERKNVRKPNGAKLGMVIYDNNNTLYITPRVSEINKIKIAED